MRNRLIVKIALAAAAFAGACSGSPTVTPPVVTNTPPTIESLVIATRAEADQPIQVAATITDAETPLTQLTYTWSALPQSGTFSGNSFSGSQALIVWRPPKGQKTPDVYTITLTLSEAYTSAGQAKQNVVSKSTTVHYNDSTAETAALAVQFIKDFGTFAVTPEQCVRNFSNTGTCAGEKQQELEQIRDNRLNFRILSSIFPDPVATFNSSLTAGTVEGQCTFEDIPNSGANAGRREFVSGTCYLTTVYEDFHWLLCISHFFDGQVDLASLKGRVPGRIGRPVRDF